MAHDEGLLNQRARLLAKPLEEERTEADKMEVVEFWLSNEKYAMESIFIEEIYPISEITVLPGSPNFLHGVINVRRRVISIVDLRPLFGLVRSGGEDLGFAMILEGDSMEFALYADRIEGVKNIALKGVQTSLPTLYGIREEFLKGVTNDGLTILDGKKLLASERLVINQ